MPKLEDENTQLKVTSSNFNDQMRLLSERYTIISIDELTRQIRDRCFDRKRQIVITFDDGYSDNFTFALPVLKRYSLPAVVYVTANYIGSDYYFWWDSVENIVMKWPGTVLEFVSPIGKTYLLRNELERRQAIWEICKDLRRLTVRAREAILASLDSHNSLRPAKIDRPMSWDEVREMANNNITIGSHTCNHPALNSISEAEAWEEIISSKDHIEGKVQRPVVHFAYPYDDLDRQKRRIQETPRRLVRDAGYHSAVTVISGSNTSKDDVWTLKRMAVQNWNAQAFHSYLEKAILS